MCYHSLCGATDGPALFVSGESGEGCLTTAIRFHQVSKRFTLHHQRPRSFQDLVIHFFGGNGSSSKGEPTVIDQSAQTREEFWALRDVSFDVEQGETVGIIGPNGAGKSTVLKLISRIIEPTSGDVEVHGRVGALLELGAGFHPDLSGRENIYLNGSILGLSRGEIEGKVEQIVTFSELERFIDIPMRHSSSGMGMRLGFSVAAHLDPDILLVDEVLAVGDENFQHKCLDRIMEIRRQGATICFVSHGLGQIRRLCTRAIWLKDGSLTAEGAVDDVIAAYLRYAAEDEETRLSAADRSEWISEDPPADGRGEETGRSKTEPMALGDMVFVDPVGTRKHVFRVGEPWGVLVPYRVYQRIEDAVVRLTVRCNDGVLVWEGMTSAHELGLSALGGDGAFTYCVDELPLMEGTYDVSMACLDRVHHGDEGVVSSVGTMRTRQVGSGERYGLVSLRGEWDWWGLDTDERAGDALSRKDNASGHVPPQKGPDSDQRRWGTGAVEVIDVAFLDGCGNERRVFETSDSWVVRLRYQARTRIEKPVFGLAVHRDDGVHVCGPNTHFGGLDVPVVEGAGEIEYRVHSLPLLEGTYLLSISAHNRMDTLMYDYHDRLYPFKVCQFGPNAPRGVVRLEGRWASEDGGSG